MRMVIVLLSVLSLGQLLNAGFDQVFNLYSPQVYESGDILDTFVYRIGLLDAQYGVATAVGFFKSVISLTLISGSYFLAYRFAKYRIFKEGNDAATIGANFGWKGPYPAKRRFEWFSLINAIFLILISLICVLPLIHIIAVSFSSSAAASAGYVKLWPVDVTLASYLYTASRHEFWDSMLVSLTRIGLGTPLNLLLTVLIAYPLSKETRSFRLRSAYAWIFSSRCCLMVA